MRLGGGGRGLTLRLGTRDFCMEAFGRAIGARRWLAMGGRQIYNL